MDIEREDTEQSIFDAYNHFVFSKDRRVLFKLLMRFRLYERVKHLPGDIVECGVFKGASILLWLKIVQMDTPHSIRKVIGFDWFDQTFVENLSLQQDQAAMRAVFARCPITESDISLEGVRAKILRAGFASHHFELVAGDVADTSRQILVDRPGLRIVLLYMDLDLEEPTYAALVNLWDRVVVGGLIVFDQYGYHAWSEANAVDRFVAERGLELIALQTSSPTAYVVKVR